MKKINSNTYGSKVLAFGAILGLLIPAILKLINMSLHINVLALLANTLFIVGIVILVTFFIYLLIEAKQDHKIDQYYSTHRNLRVPIGNGYYECKSCGNRKVREDETICNICGCVFTNEKDLDPQSIISKLK